MDKRFNAATSDFGQARTVDSGLAGGRERALRYLGKMRGRASSPPCP